MIILKMFFYILYFTFCITIYSQALEYIKINKIEIVSEDDINKKFWESFISLPLNSFVTKKEIEVMKKRLLNTKAFKKVFVKIKDEKGKKKLYFYLIAKPIIRKIVIKNNFPLLEQDIRRKIFFNEGEYFDKEKYNKIKGNVEKLFESKGFYNSDIRTIYRYSNNFKYVTIIIDVKNIGVNLIVDDINILYKNKEDEIKAGKLVKKLLTPSYWEKRTQTFYVNELKRKLKRVELKLKKEGYLNAKLKLAKLPDKNILINEYNKPTNNKLKLLLYERYSLNDLKSRYFKVTKKGFVIKFKSKKIDLWLSLSLGKKYDIVFKNHKSVSTKKLKDFTELYNQASIYPSVIKKFIKKMKQLYQSYGFYFVKIDYDEKALKKHKLIFNINEGKKLYIRNIKFKGLKNDINESDLLSLMETGSFNLLGSRGYLQEKLFIKDMKNILSYYKSKGFLHAKIEKLIFNFYNKRQYLDIIIKINEGKKVKFYKPVIYGYKNKKEIKEMQSYLKEAEGDGFNPEWFKLNANSLQQYYENIGYPFCEVKAYIESSGKTYLFYPLAKKYNSENDILEELSGRVRLYYKINRGPVKKFGSVFISGNFITKEDTIKEEIKFKKGETLNLKKITETEEALRGLGIFKTISIQLPALKDKDKGFGGAPVDVLFFLQEGENRYIDFLISTSTNEKWSFSTKMVEKNLLGYAKKISLLGKIGEIYNKVELGFESPNIFSSQINLNIKNYYKYETPPSFNLTLIGSELSFYKTLWKKLTISPSLLLEYSKTEISYSRSLFEPDLFQKLETALTNSFKISLFYENRNNIFDPRKGFAFKYSFQWAGLFDDLSNKLIEVMGINVSNEKFYKNEFSFSFYFTPKKWLTFANSIKVGIGIPVNTGKKTIPHKERYFLGGDSTVRGYDFNMAGILENGVPRGENSLLLFNTEIRFYLKNNISLALFLDAGGLAEKFNEFFTKEKWDASVSENIFYSLGFGVRYITIVGPLRLDFVPLLNDSYINKGTTFWHFNFSYPF